MDIRALYASRRTFVLLGALLIGAVVWLIYNPALQIGFFADDYEFLLPAGRLSWPEYLSAYFDPSLQWHWYRPFQGMEWRLAYVLFGRNTAGYHMLQLVFHLVNCLLLYGLVVRITGKWRVALLAALLYGSLATASLAVLWTAVADPLVAVFYLSTMWFWLSYLKSGSRRDYGLALAAYIAALLSKETAAVLPPVLFLADRWLFGAPLAFRQLVRRYALFAVALSLYLLLEFRVLTYGVFVGQLGYGVGGHILPSLVSHLSQLAFPWGLEPPLSYAWLAVVLAVLAVAAYKRNRHLLFLGAATVLPVLPILPFPAGIAQAARYLYLPLAGSAVGVALAVDGGLGLVRKWSWHWLPAVLSALVVAAIVWGGVAIAETTQNFVGFTRGTRVAFRSIFQRHETLPPDTMMYFLDRWQDNLDGIMFLRYGGNVTVDSVESDHLANLAAHRMSLVLYFDDEDKTWEEQSATQTVAQGAPSLPAKFSDSAKLEAFELVSDHVQQGDALVLILYWRATAKIEKDYTVFVHLVDANGQMVSGTDSQPRRGTAPTSSWHSGVLMPDGIVVPLGDEVLPGEYKLEVGLYDLQTMERLVILDANDQPIAGQFTIAPIYVDR